ncbi:MAG: glycoside hydrolase family 43 protein [bacterium]
MKISLIAAAAILAPSLAIGLAARHWAPTGGEARFDWFEYQGRDSVYETLKLDASHYANPILAGFYPDPSIERVGDDYYVVTSSFAYFPGLPIFHSKDLVNWTQIGSVLDRPSQLALDSAGISRGLFAPAIRYHNGLFYVVCTLIDKGGNFVVTATNPAGPWSEPAWLNFDGIDPSLFFDDSGRAYMVNNGPPVGTPLYDGHRAIWIQEFDITAKKLIGPRSVIVNGGVDLSKKPIWIEAPHIFKVRGAYYLIAAEGGTAENHSEVVFRAESVRGPYVPYPGNPILTQRHLDPARPFPITSTGHADFVQTPKGDWWAVFLGTRPYRDDMYNTGRETFLMPVHWVDGWPVILTGSATVPYVAERPAVPRQPAAPIRMSGNFTYRDDFNGTELSRTWMFIRTPRERWYDLTSSRGWLTIRARPDDIGMRAQPSFIGRRQQHLQASASTAMKFVPRKSGDKAGLVAFQNEDYFYFLGLARRGEETVVEVEMHAGKSISPDRVVIASAPLPVSLGTTVYLEIQARGDRYDFYYGTSPGKWIPLFRDADGAILSTKRAGGFVGTTLGMYAHSAAQ